MEAESMNDAIKLLKDAYLYDLPQQFDAMECKWNKLLMTNDLEKYAAILMRAFHSMAGTASSFGYQKIGENADKGEKIVKAIIAANEISEEVQSTMHQCFCDFKSALEAANLQKHYDFGPSADPWPKPIAQMQKVVIMVDDDKYFLENLSFQVECFGYKVYKFHNLKEVEKAIEQLEPAGIIMDMVFPEGDAAGAAAVLRIQERKGYHIPIIFLSRRNDIHARLAAIRAGGDAYLVKPVRPTELIDALEHLTKTEEPESCRVLIVDDDKFMADYHAELLKQHGMKTCCVPDPMKILDYLSIFNPDLILLDLNMPHCNGYDLSKLIRQVPAYFRIPIVFLSVEKNPTLQVQAMATGGDDFITKPVELEYFIWSVKLRAERMRTLRQYMERDGLSGLYNHSVMKQHIKRLFLNAVRSVRPITLAMLDLDYFKRVNDTYGHVAGDLVIVTLARFLEQRLRSSDMIGRMGGEEFAVIMPNTSVECAYAVMEELRVKFQNICHESANGVFHTTFSCGLAGYPEYSSAIDMYNAADAALYQAKTLGRNLVYKANM